MHPIDRMLFYFILLISERCEKGKAFFAVAAFDEIERTGHGDTIDPSGKRCLLFETGYRSPDSHEDILRQFLGVSFVFDKRKSCIVDTRLVLLDELPHSSRLLL